MDSTLEKTMNSNHTLETLPNIVFRQIISNLDAKWYFKLRRCSKALKIKCDSIGLKPTSNSSLIAAYQHNLLVQRPNGHDLLLGPQVVEARAVKLHCDRLMIRGKPKAMEQMLELFRKMELTARIVVLNKILIMPEPKMLEKLIKQVKAIGVESNEDFSALPCISELDFIHCRKANMSAATFLSLKARRINMTLIEPLGDETVTQFLQQYTNGERDIIDLRLTDQSWLFMRDIITAGLQLSTIWTNETHKDSTIAHLDHPRCFSNFYAISNIRKGFCNRMLLNLEPKYISVQPFTEEMDEVSVLQCVIENSEYRAARRLGVRIKLNP